MLSHCIFSYCLPTLLTHVVCLLPRHWLQNDYILLFCMALSDSLYRLVPSKDSISSPKQNLQLSFAAS